MNNKIDKAVWILKNEGPIKLTSKGINYATSRLPQHSKKTKPSEAYSYLSNPIFNITSKDISSSQEITSRNVDKINSALWFVPYFDHITYGGIFTIFRFIEHIAMQGVSTTIVIYDNKYLDLQKVNNEIVNHFPGLSGISIIIFDPERESINDLPESDISFATIWMSAYFLLKYNKTKRKYYFIQDYEPLFYEGGSMYALAESTYRFGFTGVVNTPGLLEAVSKRHGLQGVSFVPAVDSAYYYPSKQKNHKKIRIFFYARPSNPRNAFELGVLIIQELIRKYGNRIEIITAGANWDESVYGLSNKINNKGLLNSLNEVGDLYRSCDIGFVYMLSKHPSYQPFEFMGSGMATVSNRNEDNLWLLKDGENCLLAEPSVGAMAEKIGSLIDDEKLRHKIQNGGYETVSTDWHPQLDYIWNYIKKT